LLTTDAGVLDPDIGDALTQRINAYPDPETDLGTSHLHWLRAATERGLSPMDTLLAATRNIAEAYGHDDELGTVEVGKRADIVVLDADPFADSDNYGKIAHVMKDGRLVDRA